MGFRCLKSNGVLTTLQWRFFYANCPKGNQLCSGTRGAYVSPVILCRQSIF